MILWTGLAGIGGAIIFLVADALLYLSFSGERDVVTVMSQVPLWRLSLSGALGITASWFYTVAAWQLYLALRPAGRTLAAVGFGVFAASTIGTGAFHAAHAGLGLVGRGVQLAGASPAATRQALDQTWGYIAVIVQVLTVPITIFAILFVWLILAGRTWYPRWFCLCCPSYLIFANTAVDRWAADRLPSVPYLIVAGGFINTGFLLFFAASTVVLWRRRGKPVA